MNGDIEFHNVSFSYPLRQDATILRHLNLFIPVGKTTALVGASGSGQVILWSLYGSLKYVLFVVGKSTCLSLLLRFYEPSSGQITIGGESIDAFELKQWRKNLAVVGQEPVCRLQIDFSIRKISN